MAMMLEEFYKDISAVGVSAMTGDGMDALFAAIDKGAVECASACQRPLFLRGSARLTKGLDTWQVRG
jgi:hypothetical protein